MEPPEEPVEAALIEAESQPAEQRSKRPGVVIAHRVLSALAICFGLMWIVIGASLMQSRPPSTPSFSSGPGSQQQIYYHSSERDRAPTYIAFGAILTTVFAIGLFLKAGAFAYIYHTILVILLVGMWGAGLILFIWWFRQRTRNYYGIGAVSKNGPGLDPKVDN
ncbi:MAG TPA: hypothetical protein VJS64_09745 [Pyrinomonadaceae bacterium]|nr:hypothetical protein [Pyrinomonadaceae bacterium]